MTSMALLRLLQRIGLLNPNFRLFLLLLKMRLDFDASPDGDNVKDFIRGSAIGDWFVLYQMSKNLNRSFFMDFLGQVSLRFVDEVVESDEDNDTGRRKVFLLSNHMARPVFRHDH